ncbi:MAG: phosphonate metabolism protein/1,5-bisphosphokinase (PRPP-forming) PhnN [Pseudomonas sp.]
MAGRLIYLIGPSGSGKDSLLDAAREPLAEQGCRIVRRVITRSAEAVGEAAQAVSVEEFAELQAQGAFALNWQANDLFYGIPKEIDEWLAAGLDVLVNGSRGYLPQARVRYPELLALLLTVDQDVLRTRLVARGRETLPEIEARLARNAEFTASLMASEHKGLWLLDNSGPLPQTLNRLLQLIGKESACA